MRPLPLLLLAFGLLLGCGGPPELRLSAAELDFGRVPFGSGEVQTLLVENPGPEPLRVLASSQSGGEGPAAWEVWAVEPERLLLVAPGEALRLTVTYRPTGGGVDSGSLHIQGFRGDGLSEGSRVEASVLLRGEGGPSILDGDGDGWSPWDGDCDDGDPRVHPLAEERCDGLDSDCAGPEGLDERDLDEDGFMPCAGCEEAAPELRCGDCDDHDPAIHPGGAEACDGIDTDCDGILGDDFDQDGDGLTPCEGDCDDADASVHPQATEVCDDGIDNDCLGGVDAEQDRDGDGFSPCSPEGDCDDDPLARPVFVDASAPPRGDGSRDAPVATLAEALALATPGCDLFHLLPGEYVSPFEELGEYSVVELRGADRDSVVVVPSGEFSLDDEDRPVVARIAAVGPGARFTARNITFAGPGSACPEEPPHRGDPPYARFSGGAFLAERDFGGRPGVLHLVDVTVRGFRAYGLGGAVAGGGAVELERVRFEDNAVCAAESYGGALCNSDEDEDAGAVGEGDTEGRLFARDVEFVGNEAAFGGGLCLGDDSRSACDPWDFGRSGSCIERALFQENVARRDGGAVYAIASGGLLRNGLFLGNRADRDGGAVFVAESGSLPGFRLHNSTFVDDSAAGQGASIRFDEAAHYGNPPSILGNVLVHSTGACALGVDEDSAAEVTHNLAFTLGEDAPCAGGELDASNLEGDPRFVRWTADGDWNNDDFHLLPGSPALDSGPPGAAWLDPDGSPNDRGWTGGPGAAP